MDTAGRRLAEKALRLSQVTDGASPAVKGMIKVLKTAAEKGPEKFILIHSLMMKNEKYRRELEKME